MMLYVQQKQWGLLPPSTPLLDLGAERWVYVIIYEALMRLW